MKDRTLIIGAGIIGASIALHLGRAGREALVIDAGLPGQGATRRSFGWINASFFLDAHHHRLRAASMEAWDGMFDALPDGALTFRGALAWDLPPERQNRLSAELMGFGYPVEHIDQARFQAMVPDLAAPPEAALFFREGAVEPEIAAQFWLASSGARVLTGLRVEGFSVSGDRITGVETETGPIEADQVVVAAGVNVQELLATLDVHLPMLRRPGLILKTRPVRPCLDAVLVTPFGEVRQDASGRILATTLAGHQTDTSEQVTGSPEVHGAAALDKLRAMLPGLDLHMESVSLALRPMPADEYPAIGPIGPKGLYVAVMHSGVTLAPIAGALAAEELTTGKPSPMLAPYRPDRLARRQP